MTYRFTATSTGFRIKVVSEEDRKRFRCIAPVCAPDDVLSKEEAALLYPASFKPAILAQLSGRFSLDLHSISGLSGYGRFAVSNPKYGEKWLDDFDSIEAEFSDGLMLYSFRDSLFGSVRMMLTGTTGSAAAIIKVICDSIDEETRAYFVYGGMLGHENHCAMGPGYLPGMCYDNHIEMDQDRAVIRIDRQNADIVYDCPPKIRLKESRMGNCASKRIAGFKQYVYLRGTGERFYSAPPDMLITAKAGSQMTAPAAQNGVVYMPFGRIGYFAVGIGSDILEKPLEALFNYSCECMKQYSHGLTVKCGLPLLEGLNTLCSLNNYCLFNGDVFTHGLSSWRDGYLGWRTGYGSLAYGFRENTRKHIVNHLNADYISDGPDKGALFHMYGGGRAGAETFYSMYETFLDQAHKYLDYTNDLSFKSLLLRGLEGCFERAVRRLKPGDEWVFENSLNTWISDSHWSIMGQCTQSSAYMYSFALLLAELCDDHQRDRYLDIAEKIRTDTKRILWMKRKGVFAYCRDLRGHQLLHDQPELADIYHSAESGLTDRYETYQMLDWVEGNLPKENTLNGGVLYWNSNWHPNTADSYTHTSYDLATGEQLNLAMIYQQIGLAENGYELLKSMYNAVYGGDFCDIVDHNLDQYVEKGQVNTVKETACGIPGQVHINGTSRRTVDFADSISMLGREIAEGLLGIKPDRMHGIIHVCPCLPGEIDNISIKGALVSYSYHRSKGYTGIHITNHCQDSRIHPTLWLPVCTVDEVLIDGKPADYTLDTGFLALKLLLEPVAASEVRIEVKYREIQVDESAERLRLDAGQSASFLFKDETVLQLIDPQALLESANTSSCEITARAGNETGTGVFFVLMEKEGTRYIRPVKVEILPRDEHKAFVPLTEAFSAPYEWCFIDMDDKMNASSPLEAMNKLAETLIPVPREYSQVNLNYFKSHLTGMNKAIPRYTCTDLRWKNKIDANGIAYTDEGIPFRSGKEGCYFALTSLVSRAYPSSVDINVNKSGRAIYLLVTGVTYPMQSHVENLRITIEYEDGITEIHKLINPYDIGDMWYTNMGRYHDTVSNGFENLSGNNGALSSVGLDLTKPIETDTEAHIICYPIKKGATVRQLHFETYAMDCAFGLIGVTILK